MSGNGHYGDELQDLLDGRLSPEEEERIRAHVQGCAACGQQLEALRWVKRLAAGAGVAELPAGLEAEIRTALDRESRPGWPRRAVLSAAAALLIALAGKVVLTQRRRAALVADVAHDYHLYRSGSLPLEITAAEPELLESFYRERGLRFRTRVFDLAMMNFRVRGGRVHRLAGRASAFFVYEGDLGRVLVCLMYPGRLEELPSADEVRFARGFSFHIYRRDGLTLVFWQEGEVVCVLAGDFSDEQVIGLAFEKAML